MLAIAPISTCTAGIDEHKCAPDHDDDLPSDIASLIAAPSGALSFDDDYDDDLAAESHTFLPSELSMSAAAEQASGTKKTTAMRRGSAGSWGAVTGMAVGAVVCVVGAVVVVMGQARKRLARQAAELEGMSTRTAMALHAGQCPESGHDGIGGSGGPGGMALI